MFKNKSYVFRSIYEIIRFSMIVKEKDRLCVDLSLFTEMSTKEQDCQRGQSCLIGLLSVWTKAVANMEFHYTVGAMNGAGVAEVIHLQFSK